MTAELRHIEAFLAVARAGNFTRAAADLHVSQPALTVQIRQLETALGLRLFDRNNRRVALTQPGRELVAPFERVLLDVRSIVESAHDFAAHRRGVVTVASLPSIAAAVLPRAIAELALRHQGIAVRVRDVVADQVVALVKSGEADFGLGSCGVERDVTAQPLFADRLAAFVPKHHRLAARRHVTLREVAAYPLVLTSRDSSLRELVERALDHDGLSVTVAHEATYMTTALGLAAAGLGVAILPDAANTSASRAIRRVEIRKPVLTRQIGILTRAGRSLPPAAHKLVEVLQRSNHRRSSLDDRASRSRP
jgi:LysR family transcriptional regulator, carnitine catabolism transcriptional activator